MKHFYYVEAASSDYASIERLTESKIYQKIKVTMLKLHVATVEKLFILIHLFL